MFSLQTIFGQGKQFYTLLEDAAAAAHDSARALHAMLRESDRQPALDAFKLARLREREVSEKISQQLVDSFRRWHHLVPKISGEISSFHLAPSPGAGAGAGVDAGIFR